MSDKKPGSFGKELTAEYRHLFVKRRAYIAAALMIVALVFWYLSSQSTAP